MMTFLFTSLFILCMFGGSCANLLYKSYDNYQDLFINCTGNQLSLIVKEIVCRNSFVNCSKYADCHIICDGDEACYGMTVICPSDGVHQCNVSCHGASSCALTTFYGNGKLSCIGQGACSQTMFPVPLPNDLLSIHCQGSGACSRSKIYCPSNSGCNVYCNGSLSCFITNIEWPHCISQESILSCSDDYRSCDYANRPHGGYIDHDIYYSNEDFNVNCGTTFNCTGNITHCPLNASCHANCTNMGTTFHSCMGTTFKWDKNQTYSLTALNTTTLQPFGQNLLYNLDCAHGFRCRHSIIICPRNAVCNIDCAQGVACQGAIIYGPIGHPLTVNCIYTGNDGDQQCHNAIIYAQQSSHLVIRCSVGFWACTRMQLWTPINTNGLSGATILVGEFRYYDGIIIYSIGGWKDVNFTNSHTSNFSGTMHCGPNYGSVCHWNSTTKQCMEVNAICDNVNLSPIIKSTIYPSELDTNSTANPTNNTNSNNTDTSTTKDASVELNNNTKVENARLGLNLFMIILIIAGFVLFIILIIICFVWKRKEYNGVETNDAQRIEMLNIGTPIVNTTNVKISTYFNRKTFPKMDEEEMMQQCQEQISLIKRV